MNPKYPLETFPGRLKYVREKVLELKQRELAAHLGYNKSTYGNLERGRTEKVPAKLVNGLQEKFSINPKFLLDGRDNPPRLVEERDPDEARIVEVATMVSYSLNQQTKEITFSEGVIVDSILKLLKGPRTPARKRWLRKLADIVYEAMTSEEDIGPRPAAIEAEGGAETKTG